jgi:hypothetical protein
LPFEQLGFAKIDHSVFAVYAAEPARVDAVRYTKMACRGDALVVRVEAQHGVHRD